jgi:hypothetical protein
MNDLLSGILHGISLLLVLGLTLYWITAAVGSARRRRWNDFFYSLSILLIMWSGLDLILGIVAVLAVMWIHWYIAQRENF